MALTVIIATYLRVSHVDILEGQYLLGNDAYRFLYQAERIAEGQGLPERDMMRWLPVGRDLTTHLNLSSYVIASTWFLAQPLLPQLTVYQVAVYYPMVCYALMLVVFFYLVRRLVNTNVALVAAMLLAISPVMLQRSAAGFADRDALCLLLFVCAAYGYVRALQTSSSPWRGAWMIVSGACIALLGLTWEGVGLFIAILLIGHFAKFIFVGYSRQDLWLYLCWLTPMMVGLCLFTRAYRTSANYSSPFGLVAIGMPLVLLVLFCIYLLVQRLPAVSNRLSFGGRLPLSIALTAGLAFLSIILVGVWIASSQTMLLRSLKANFLSPLGQSRLMVTLAELEDYSLKLWYEHYRFHLVCFSIGVILLLHRFCATILVDAWLVSSAYIAMLAVILYHQVPAWLPIGFASNTLYLISILGFLLFIGTLYTMRRIREPGPCVGELHEEHLLIFAWFTIGLFMARGAVRYAFFFVPAASICSAYTLVYAYQKYCWRVLKEQHLRYVALSVLLWVLFTILQGWRPYLLIVAILVSLCVVVPITRQIIRTRHPYHALNWMLLTAAMLLLVAFIPSIGADAQRSRFTSMRLHVSATPSLRQALSWIRNHLPETAVIASDWDRGSHINALARRATVVDEDHFIPYWIHLMARHVLCAQSEMEALAFLKTRGATHLLLDQVQLANLGILSYIGSDESLDRQSYSTYVFEIALRREDSLFLLLHYRTHY